jgi:hypothetical protein
MRFRASTANETTPLAAGAAGSRVAHVPRLREDRAPVFRQRLQYVLLAFLRGDLAAVIDNTT